MLHFYVTQPFGFTTHWLFSLALVWMFSGVTYQLRAMIKRIRMEIRTLWWLHGHCRLWRGHWVCWMSCQLTTGISMLVVWCYVLKTGLILQKNDHGQCITLFKMQPRLERYICKGNKGNMRGLVQGRWALRLLKHYFLLETCSYLCELRFEDHWLINVTAFCVWQAKINNFVCKYDAVSILWAV